MSFLLFGLLHHRPRCRTSFRPDTHTLHLYHFFHSPLALRWLHLKCVHHIYPNRLGFGCPSLVLVPVTVLTCHIYNTRSLAGPGTFTSARFVCLGSSLIFLAASLLPSLSYIVASLSFARLLCSSYYCRIIYPPFDSPLCVLKQVEHLPLFDPAFFVFAGSSCLVDF